MLYRTFFKGKEFETVNTGTVQELRFYGKTHTVVCRIRTLQQIEFCIRP